MTSTLADHTAVEEVAPDEYVSKNLPANMGVALPIAYGGWTLGIAVHAACLTAPAAFHLYSVLGHYLSPGSLESKMKCKVSRTRDTKSFATRRVQVTQVQPDGKSRVVMELTADFHIREAGGLNYSAPPSGRYPPPEKAPTNEEEIAGFIARGKLTEEDAVLHSQRYEPLGQLFDIRQCPGSVASQNLYGLLKPIATTQDHLPPGSKISAEWIRMREPPGSHAAQMAALAFGLDGGIATLPLVHSDVRLEEIMSASSLDFALRIMQPDIDFNKWHISERTTTNSAGAISYGEQRVWDEKGNLVASMTQQCILRLWPKASL